MTRQVVNRWSRRGPAMIALALALVLAAAAGAATASLELQKFEQSPVLARPGSTTGLERLVSGMSRGLSIPVKVDEDGAVAVDPDYRNVVKKEPAGLQCEYPIRGVLRIGSRAFGYIFDATDLAKSGYSRLYFDRNGNGDLSDDAPLEAVPARRSAGSSLLLGRLGATSRVAPATATVRRAPAYSYSMANFPALDLSIQSGGQTFDYRVFPYLYATLQTEGKSGLRGGTVTFRPGTYRKGEIELGGKKMVAVLLDSNGNGAFNDPLSFAPMGTGISGRVRPVYGDTLVVLDENALPTTRLSFATMRDGVHVTKLYKVGDDLYQLHVTPAGDKITLDPSGVGTGKVKCPGKGFSGVIYGDLGFMSIDCRNGGPVDVPAGEWKVYQYTIDMSTAAAVSATTATVVGSRNYTRVTGVGTGESPAFKVEKGKSVSLPFGGPYRALVTAAPGSAPKDALSGVYAQLSLALVGKGNEVLTGMYVGGQRPDAPTFVVADSRGRKVDAGAFQFG